MAYRTVRARRADGTEFVADVSVRRIHDGGVPLTLVVARDGTARAADRERRALEERLRQARQQEALAALCGGVAHDLNNVLTAILGYTETARGRVADHPAAVGDLRLAEGAVYRARMLVDQLRPTPAGPARTCCRPPVGARGRCRRAVADHLGRPVPARRPPRPRPGPGAGGRRAAWPGGGPVVANAAEAAGPDMPPEVHVGPDLARPDGGPGEPGRTGGGIRLRRSGGRRPGDDGRGPGPGRRAILHHPAAGPRAGPVGGGRCGEGPRRGPAGPDRAGGRARPSACGCRRPPWRCLCLPRPPGSGPGRASWSWTTRTWSAGWSRRCSSAAGAKC